jgi:Cytochrome c554 and c-prime
MASDSGSMASTRAKRVYRAPISGGLRVLLVIVLCLFALLAANSAYLLAIRYMEWKTGQVWQNYIYIQMFLLHLIFGFLLIVPLLVFIGGHLRRVHRNRNRRAVRAGYALMVFSIIVVVSGLLLTRIDGLVQINDGTWRSVIWWLHVVVPGAVVWIYILHRLAGRPIRWRIGAAWSAVTMASIAAIIFFHHHDPRQWNVVGPKSGEAYFFPSLARTSTGNFVPASALNNNAYCLECHKEAHRTWMHSAHHLSSFNNPVYLFAVQNTRKAMMERDGNVQGARFCAGCHDPVPFLSGAFDDPRFDDPDYDLENDVFAQAGITCTACHAISHVNDNRGNASYTIDEPIAYPFTDSENALLRWVSRQLVKAKPDFHKKTYLKPLHRSAEFCGTCHKVHLPEELNEFRWLRGQNHFDSFWLSGVSGHNVESFYYPPVAQQNCNGCHMPLLEVTHSGENPNFAARVRDDSGKLKTFNHQFPSSNTAIPWLLRDKMDGCLEAIEKHAEFNKDIVRIDLFGLREDGKIDGKLLAPAGEAGFAVEAGKTYLLETVVRTLKLGHALTEGTGDSNELWLEVIVLNDGVEIGRSGGIDPRTGAVDPWSHHINSFVIDRHGNRINRRNPEDIFVALYNNQIPPGAADTIRYRFTVPENATGQLEIHARLRYRKFDAGIMQLAMQATRGIDPATYRNDLPIMNLASASATIPVGTAATATVDPKISPQWQRWNDYGIGMLRRGQLRQAEEAFQAVESAGIPDGALNLARVYLIEGLVLDKAPDALKRAKAMVAPDGSKAKEWTVLWFSALVSKQNGDYAAAIYDLEQIESGAFQQAVDTGFDFSKDYRLLNELAESHFTLADTPGISADETLSRQHLAKARDYYLRTLEIEPENSAAHYGLQRVYERLDDDEAALHHDRLHQKYKLDDNLRDSAILAARKKYPAADAAAERAVIYDLQRDGGWPVNRTGKSFEKSASPTIDYDSGKPE